MHWDGQSDTPLYLYEAARDVLNLNEELHRLALHNVNKVLGVGPAFDAVMREGCTYASAARQVRVKLVSLASGKAV